MDTKDPVTPLKILHIARNDPAGSVYRLVRAQRMAGHRSRMWTWERKYSCRFPEDIYGTNGPGFGADMIPQADVIHLHLCDDSAPYQMALEADVPVLVAHLHGEDWMEHTLRLGSCLAFVSTPDLLEVVRKDRDDESIPLPIRAQDMAAPMPLHIPHVIHLSDYAPTSPPPFDGTLLVAHAPTNRARKGTDEVVKALKDVPDVELLVAENMSHAETLEHLRRGHVVLDQWTRGWGVTTVEAMAMGRMPIANLVGDAQYLRHASVAHAQSIPELVTTLKFMRDCSPSLDWRSAGPSCREHMERHYPDPVTIAEMTIAAYQERMTP